MLNLIRNLHSTFWLVLMMLGIMQIAACTRPKDPAPVINCRLTTIEKGKDTLDRTYEYDTQGRVVKVVSYYLNNIPYITTTYSYTSTSMSCEVANDKRLISTYSSTIGANGYVSGRISSHSGLGYHDTTSYEYDAGGYLIKEVNRRGNPIWRGWLEITTSKYIYKNGNRVICDQTVKDIQPNPDRTRTYWYWTDYEYDETKLNHLYEPDTKLLGKANRNVIKKAIRSDLTPFLRKTVTTHEYSYNFDDRGYISQQTIHLFNTADGKTVAGNPYRRYFLYQCQ